MKFTDPFITGYWFSTFSTGKEFNIDNYDKDDVFRYLEALSSKITVNTKDQTILYNVVFELDTMGGLKAVLKLNEYKNPIRMPLNLYYYTTAPNGITVHYSALYKNLNLLNYYEILDKYMSSDVSDNNKLSYEVKFSYDSMEIGIDDNKVFKDCQALREKISTPKDIDVDKIDN